MADEPGPATETEDEESPVPARPVPMGIVVARIVTVSGIGVAGALAIFLLVGGLWLPGLAALGATVLFLFLMFAIERAAE
jgi:hypothetical protein